MRLPGRELQELLGPAVPSDHARQTIADRYIERELGRPRGRAWRVLDLGCGSGSSVDFFRARDPEVQWVGLDVADPHQPQTRSDATFETFDGVTIPFDDGSFDLIYCKQVFEHVRHPSPLLGEVRRVLAAGGYIAGSTSQLEPFHSRSMWNYTPVGFCELLRENGLRLIEVRPGIDGVTLIARRLVGSGRLSRRLWGRWWGGESPLHRAIDGYGRLLRLDAGTVNATKLLFSGQFAFLAQRVDPWVPARRSGRAH
ncbi:MAG: class I SAM-dependent methyltransferase [Solirubrobacteraceae bacterium]